MYAYDTVSAAVSELKKRGYSMDFNLKAIRLICHEDKFDINDFEIVEVLSFQRFRPADEAVVYASESSKGQKVCWSMAMLTSDAMSAEMAKKLHVHKN